MEMQDDGSHVTPHVHWNGAIKGGGLQMLGGDLLLLPSNLLIFSSLGPNVLIFSCSVFFIQVIFFHL